MSDSSAESLAREVAEGNYIPSALDDCKAHLPVDANPHVMRFTQLILFANPDQDLSSPKEPEYMIFQQYQFSRRPIPILDQLVKPMAKHLSEELVAGRLPLPDDEEKSLPLPEDSRISVNRIRAFAVEHRIPGYRPNLSEESLRPLFENWAADLKRDRFLSALEPLERAGFTFQEELAADLRDLPGLLTKVLTKVFLPSLYQPFKNPYPHFAFCTTFEQVWEPRGYTRGELINTISLAPGEQLTLEIHSWDKSTIKSEEELATETEFRVSENLTQRDVLSVARELATEFGGHLNASAEIPIYGVPVQFDGGVSSKVNMTLKQNLEQTRERTVQASQTLKTMRKLRIEVAREVGREQKQTHVIANTNRCHSVNCHYFEVMSNYLVTTKLLSLQPCLLFPNPGVKVTPGWVLCHQDALVQVLIDKTFLSGFKAAEVLETHDRFLALKKEEAKAKGEVSNPLQQELKRHVDAILGAYETLNKALGKVKKAGKSQACAAAAVVGGQGAWAVCVAMKAPTALRRLLYLALLYQNEVARNALEKLKDDNKNTNAKASENLRSFFASVTPRDYQFSAAGAALAKGLEALGVPEKLVTALLGGSLMELVADDAGLYNAVKAAAAKLEDVWELPPTTEAGVPKEGFSTIQVAEAQVQFEQLRCHIDDNWLHYMQAMWLHEHPDERFLRLQGRGVVATILDNDLVGFLGHKAAYPIRDVDVAAVKPWIDFADLKQKAKDELEREESKPQLITLPTHGTILEAIVGECDACEDFIKQSRVIDLRVQEAKAQEEESEAARYKKRVDSGDYADPKSLTAGKVVIRIDGDEIQPPG